jgi:hypothetical protein
MVLEIWYFKYIYRNKSNKIIVYDDIYIYILL